MTQIQTVFSGRKFQNQLDSHLKGKMASLIREAVWPWKLEKQESQSHVLAVSTWTVSREEGVGQISLITKSCWLPVERISCDSSESCVTTHWNHFPMWCHVTYLQGGQQNDQWPEKLFILLEALILILNFIPLIFAKLWFWYQIMMCWYFSSFLKKLYVANSFLLTLLYSTIKYKHFYLEV